MKDYHLTLSFGDYSADLVLGGEWSLYDFAYFILGTVGFDDDHPFEFCNNLKRPYQSTERYSLFADLGEGDDPGVKNVRVSQVFRPRRKMIFLFDYGDDWFFLITCMRVKESEAKHRFRKVVATTGEPPEQYPGMDDEW